MSSDTIETTREPEPSLAATPASTAPGPVPPTQGALPPGYAYVPVRRDPKSPAAAVLLSFFPGLGQVYNGQIPKALLFFGIWLGSFYVVVEGNPIPWVFIMLFTHLFAFVDAYRSAALINARAAGGAVAEPEERLDSPWWGIGLLVLGTLLLVSNLGWVSLADLERFWPVLLIAAGALTLWNTFQQRRAREARDETDPRA